MKKSISISAESLQFLGRLVNSAPFSSSAEARKIRQLAVCIDPSLKAFGDSVRAIEKDYIEVKKDEKGNSKATVPPEKRDAYESQLKSAKETMMEVLFDVESFAFIGVVIDRVFAHPKVKEEGGLVGVEQARYLSEISDALEKAKES